ncbi:G-protein-signaling modulator 2-like [Watersipora subatra]|uniref:G-protein-signaling modulator 2-like n=1 Tax=Watersipora subatra TaxID=2589382 RepID=UPI00355BF91E
MEGSCLQLALEGERLCKSGDCVNGVQFFEAAVKSGTDDLKVLSAIYSQLGNAYFYLQQYDKAFDYHKHDLNLTRSMGDSQGEAKASGNLGNTLKVLGNYDEAIVCCQRHLDLAEHMNDKVSIARARYNLGNVYHTKAKHMGSLGSHDPGEFPEPVKDALLKALDHYMTNLDLVQELGDRAAEGRAAGNLGNTFYLLGNFTEAINFHKQRLAIGKEFGDTAAERRAYSNLGNSHIFLGEFELAIDYYKKALQLSKQLGDLALEAQACYSLGNSATLLRDYGQAIDYHLKHLHIAQELQDRLGQGRAYWSLSNAHTALGNHSKALQFAQWHLEVSKEIRDEAGRVAATNNLRDLRMAMGGSPHTDSSSSKRSSVDRLETLGAGVPRAPSSIGSSSNGDAPRPSRPPSERNGGAGNITPIKSRPDHVQKTVMSPNSSNDEDSFFDMLTKFQGRRLDDQRSSFRLTNGATPHRIDHTKKEQLMDIVAGVQGSRINDQRANFPGLRNRRDVMSHLLSEQAGQGDGVPDDNFFDQLMRCQSTRLEEQRTTLPRGGAATGKDVNQMSAPTVPDEDFFSMISRLQSNRLDEQRYEFKKPDSQARVTASTPKASTSKVSMTTNSKNSSDKKKKK